MSRRALSSLALLALAVSALVGAGCQGVHFIRVGQTPPHYRLDMPDESLLPVAQERIGSVHTFRCYAVDVTARSPEEKFKFDATIILRAPDQARVVGEKAVAGTVFDLVADGNTVRNYVPNDKTVYVYRVSPGQGRSMATMPWGLILGVRPDRGAAFPLQDVLIHRTKSDVVLEGILPDERLVETLIFDRETLLLRSRLIGRAGARGAAVEAEYAEWMLIGKIWWPMRVVIRLPEKAQGPAGAGGEIKIEMDFPASKVKLNPDISPKAFILDVPPGTKEVPKEANPDG